MADRLGSGSRAAPAIVPVLVDAEPPPPPIRPASPQPILQTLLFHPGNWAEFRYNLYGHQYDILQSRQETMAHALQIIAMNQQTMISHMTSELQELKAIVSRGTPLERIEHQEFGLPASLAPAGPLSTAEKREASMISQAASTDAIDVFQPPDIADEVGTKRIKVEADEARPIKQKTKRINNQTWVELGPALMSLSQKYEDEGKVSGELRMIKTRSGKIAVKSEAWKVYILSKAPEGSSLRNKVQGWSLSEWEEYYLKCSNSMNPRKPRQKKEVKDAEPPADKSKNENENEKEKEKNEDVQNEDPKKVVSGSGNGRMEAVEVSVG
ncbi:hypothetical protein HYALB_00001197 [Hymenoscyphus albidus]|uniref:Uncharacterized protein n=1 Tax=Hymenoscyphus albidus TaxID=595503 RepID=A0A9N9LG22_9HELO|nr:hypothetical protein HYALB_00001197 [Hymenoscyphus albidus]